MLMRRQRVQMREMAMRLSQSTAARRKILLISKVRSLKNLTPTRFNLKHRRRRNRKP